ncbi:MAG: hypothetical protein NW216_06575 [Hyphomicrobium sp.]|nr:hypothetical protein [Hyphomicrobium sp.]
MSTIVVRSSDPGAAAAQDAAREEMAERATKSAPEKAPKAGKDGWHRFTVDVWITPFNSIEFGIYKKSRNKAKSRQFTSDMDVYAEVLENGERTGVLGYREDLWKDNLGMDKRLVFKLFSANLGWRATMDLMVGRSLQQTIGARGLPITAFSINTDEDNFLIYLERSGNKWPLLPENFSFFLMNDNQPEFYRLKRALIDLGGDYTLYDQAGNVVGTLDGKVFSIGGKWFGKVKQGHADKRLLTVMKLFAGMLIFNTDSKRHMKRLYREVRAGRLKPRIERQEADLYMNPRRVR